MAFTTVAIAGTAHNPDGSVAANATVQLALSEAITDGTTDILPVVLSTVTANDGTFDFAEVIANDDSTTTPVGSFYTVTITSTLNVILNYFKVVIPHASAPSVDLFSLAEIGSAPAAATPYVVSIEGLNGVVTVVSPDASVTIGTSGSEITLEAAGATSLQKANNLSDVADAGTSRANLHIPALSAAAVVVTANVAALSGLNIYDGYQTVAGDLVLLTGQSTASQDGLYSVAAGSWTRPTEMATGVLMKARTCPVIQGTVYGGSTWLLKTNATVTVDTTAQVWVQQLPSSVVNASLVFSVVAPSGDATGVTDLANLQTALTACRIAGGGVVKGIQGATYTISSYPVIGSNTTLDMTGCTIILVANANSGNGSNMLRNYGYNNPTATGTATMAFNANTAISTVAAAVGQTVVIGQGGNQAAGNGNGPLVANVSAVTGSGPYTLTLMTLDGRTAPCTNASGVTSTQIIVYNRDTNIKVVGGTWNRGANSGAGYSTAHSLLLRFIDGIVIDIDNMIATAGKYGVAPGGITNFWIRIRNGSSTSSIFQMNGPAWNGRIDYIGGTQFDDLCPLTAGDYTSEQDTAGDIIGVEIGTVTGTSTGANGVKLIAGAGRIVDGIRIGLVTGSVLLNGVWIGDDSGSASTTGGVYGSIDVGMVALSVCTSGSPLALYSPAAERIKVGVSHRIAASARPAVAVLGASTVTIKQLIVEGDVSGTATGVVIVSNASCTVTQVVCRNLTFVPASGVALVDAHHGLITQLILDGCQASGLSGIVQQDATNAAITETIVNGGNYVGAGGSSVFFTDLTGITSTLVLNGPNISGFKYVATAAGTLTVALNVPILAATTSALHAAGGSLTVLGAATVYPTTAVDRAASETVRVNGITIPVDVAILTPTDGDVAKNSNATTLTTGPAVYSSAGTGHGWKSLYSGNTY